MALPRSTRLTRTVDGPHPVRSADIAPLNEVFSEAFTERYRRDGMAGVRVPFLSPVIWQYAVQDADGGAMLWRGERGEIAAFNIVHRSGAEGWMGPLAVRPSYQGSGVGKRIVSEGVKWLREQGATVIGLETMPRTMDNIGFYSALGFDPGRLTLTVTVEAAPAERPATLLGRLEHDEQPRWLAACRELANAQIAGYDFTRELEITHRLALGDTLLLRDGDRLRGFALCHTSPLVEGRTREELRVLKLVMSDLGDVDEMVRLLADYARRSGTRRAAIRVQGEYGELFRRLLDLGGRVRWTDLRMTVSGFAEPRARTGVVLSNWEI